jgi:hypothetical protein
MLQPTLPTGFIQPCLPTKTDKLPSGSQWLHEIKHDGFRVIARKDGPRVRLYSRPGNDLTRRFPLIVETLARLLPVRRGRSRHEVKQVYIRCCFRETATADAFPQSLRWRVLDPHTGEAQAADLGYVAGCTGVTREEEEDWGSRGRR